MSKCGLQSRQQVRLYYLTLPAASLIPTLTKGGRARLDCSGVLFLRSLCKLTHVGHGQYYKGDGNSFQDFLEEHYPGVTNKCVDRAEHSKRQDWSLEAAYDIFPLIDPLLDYTVRTLLDKSNILRDSVLMQAECIHFEAYIHVCSIMWRVVFKELRGLTNSKGLEINPLELNSIYEYLHDLGTMLQSESCFQVFADEFRPWPHVYKNKGRSKKFYGGVDANLKRDLERLRINQEREDANQYKSILREVFGCFGYGIIDSLEYTMKDYLHQTDGPLRNDLREPWENKAVQQMVSHNNHAERPFAVVKEFWNIYPSLSLSNLSWLSHSISNGTHRCAEIYGPHNKRTALTTRLAGIAITAHPDLKRAVNKLCSVRRKSIGRVTALAREAHKQDKAVQVANRKRKAK